MQDPTRAARGAYRSGYACLCALFFAGCARGPDSGPERAVRAAVQASAAEDALAFQRYVATAEIAPADGMILVAALPHVEGLAVARRLEDAASVEAQVRPPGLGSLYFAKQLTP